MSFFGTNKDATWKISCAIVLLMLMALVSCANAPQSAIETDEAEITETLVNAIRRYTDIEPFHNGYALVIHDTINDTKVHFGYINMSGEEVVPCVSGIDAMAYFKGDPNGIGFQFEDGLAAVVVNDKCGFFNTKGEQVIPCQYDMVDDFSEGLAAVGSGEEYGNYKWGFVNTDGEEVIPCQYIDANPFSEGLAAVGVGVESWNCKYGFINKKGEEVIHCQYDKAGSFSEGLANVKINGQWKAINNKGEVVFCYHHGAPEYFFFINSFSDGLVAVQRDEKWGFVDTSGKVIVPCQYDWAKSFSEGLAAVRRDGSKLEWKWGFINTKGEEAVPCLYDDVEDFSEGLAVVKRDGKYGFINTKGEEIIPCQYDRARSFSNGFAIVYLAYYDAIPPIKGIIDKKGNTTFTQEDWDEYEKWKREKKNIRIP